MIGNRIDETLSATKKTAKRKVVPHCSILDKPSLLCVCQCSWRGQCWVTVLKSRDEPTWAKTYFEIRIHLRDDVHNKLRDNWLVIDCLPAIRWWQIFSSKLECTRVISACVLLNCFGPFVWHTLLMLVLHEELPHSVCTLAGNYSYACQPFHV